MHELDGKPCRICGAPVTRTRRRTRQAWYYPRQCRACWKKARDEATRRARISAAMTTEQHPRWRPLGSRRIHLSRDGVLYWEVKVEGCGRGRWRYEHRVIAEALLGRVVRAAEVIHHRDGNTLNNDPSNLDVMDRGSHTRHHHQQRRGNHAKRQQVATTSGGG
jgi:hypothetical protein